MNNASEHKRFEGGQEVRSPICQCCGRQNVGVRGSGVLLRLEVVYASDTERERVIEAREFLPRAEMDRAVDEVRPEHSEEVLRSLIEFAFCRKATVLSRVAVEHLAKGGVVRLPKHGK